MSSKQEADRGRDVVIFPPGITMKPNEHSGFSNTFINVPPNTAFETLHPVIGIKGIFKRLELEHPDFGWNAVFIFDGLGERNEMVVIENDHPVELF